MLLTGPIDFGQHGVLTSNGASVLLYLTGTGSLNFQNNAELHIKAPTLPDRIFGIAIFQDPADTQGFGTGNNFLLDVTGAIFMPGSDVDIPNSLLFANTTCTLFIAHSLNIRNGNGTLSNSGCASTFGGAAYLSVSIAE